MSFNRMDAALNAAVFAHLSDDLAAVWRRGGQVIGTLPAMIEQVERPTSSHGLAIIETVDVVRFPIAAVDVLGAELEPMAGDVLTVNGVDRVLHGQPWRELEKGRDWLCPVVT